MSRTLSGLLLVLLVGCGGKTFEGEEAPPPPTNAELSRFVAETRRPAYWLGPRFRGLGVSDVSADRSGVHLTYGPWTCDTGCTPDGSVLTGRRSIADDLTVGDYDWPIDPKKCWSRVGKAVAVMLGCDPAGGDQEMLVFSGANEIYVSSLYTPDREIPALAVLPHLRPLNDAAAWPLPRPVPLSCHEFDDVDRRYRRHMPQPLRPRDC